MNKGVIVTRTDTCMGCLWVGGICGKEVWYPRAEVARLMGVPESDVPDRIDYKQATEDGMYLVGKELEVLWEAGLVRRRILNPGTIIR